MWITAKSMSGSGFFLLLSRILNNLTHHFRLWLFLFLFFAFIPFNTQASSLETVRLQLDWKYQFEFAGFIAAVEQGFYQEAGLNVELLEYEAGTDTVARVLSGEINYGIHNSSLVITQGEVQPIVLLATFFQRSPLVFVTHPEIQSPAQLLGKRVMGTKDEFKYSSLALLLSHFKVNEDNSKIIEHTFAIDDFVSGKIDAMSAFLSNQIYELDKAGVAYNIIDPFDYGFFMTAVNLFTSRAEALDHTDRTKRFVAASIKGWKYAFAHTPELISIIHDKYAPNYPLEKLQFEAETSKKLFLLDFHPIGAVNTELSSRAYKQLRESGLLKKDHEQPPYLLDDVVQNNMIHKEFTPEERQYLQQKKVITFCADPQWMPFESIIEGKHVGIAADYFAHFQAQLPIPLRLVPTSSWQQSMEFARDRKCDLFSLASSTPSRDKYMHFTSPYLSLPVVLATRTDQFFIDRFESVLDKKIGIVKGYAIGESLKQAHPTANIVDVASIKDGLKRVESGELFGYIDNLMTIAASVQQDFTDVIKVSGRLPDNVALSVGTRNDEPLLHAIFEKLLANTTPDFKQGVLNRWTVAKEEVGGNKSLLVKVIAGFLFVGALFAVHNFQLRRYNRMLSAMSYHDQLTGLYNRFRLDEVLRDQEERFERYAIDASLILIDIDHFKHVNDRLGHPVGDKLLAQFSKLLQDNIRSVDTIGRWGGEEFLIIAPQISLDQATEMAEKLLQIVRNTEFPDIGRITVSMGISSYRCSGNSLTALAEADQALYTAKDRGRNQVHAANHDRQEARA